VHVWLQIHNMSLPVLLKTLFTEGHPAFFYLIIYPFVKVGLSIFAVQLLCWLSMTFAVFILLTFSPFYLITNILIVLSSGMLYFFPIIARSYSFIPPLIFCAAAFYTKSKKHPISYALIVCCIANTHIIMFGFASCLFLQFIYENFIKTKGKHNIRLKIALVIMLISILTVSINIFGAVFFNPIYEISHHSFKEIINTLYYFFVNMYNNYTLDLVACEVPLNLLSFTKLLIIAITITYLLIILKKLSLINFLIAVLAISSQIIIYIASYPTILPQRVFCFHLIIIFCLWTSFLKNDIQNLTKEIYYKKAANIFISILFIIAIPTGLDFINKDIKGNFSSAKEMATAIKQLIPNTDDNIVFTSNPVYSLAVIYYLNDRNVIFNEKPVKYSIPEAQPYIDLPKYTREHKNVFLILTQKENKEAKKFKVIYVTKPSIVRWEMFCLVRIL